MRRLLVAILVLNLLLSLVALGWVAWVVVEPRYWLPGAYEKPERPEPQVTKLDLAVLAGRVTLIQSDVSNVEARTRGLHRTDGRILNEKNAIKADLEKLWTEYVATQSLVFELCEALALAYNSLESGTYELIVNLRAACR